MKPDIEAIKYLYGKRLYIGPSDLKVLFDYIAELEAELAKFHEAPRNPVDGSYQLSKLPEGASLYYKDGE